MTTGTPGTPKSPFSWLPHQPATGRSLSARRLPRPPVEPTRRTGRVGRRLRNGADSVRTVRSPGPAPNPAGGRPMRSLRLVALSDDGKNLVLAAYPSDSMDDDGEPFELAIDERLRAALRADSPKQTASDPGNDLSPRVIQARIRAGETPEQVAHASGTRVERIMRFAYPVLQERARVAEQAREARVRLSEGTPSVPLEQFMSERLRLLGADLDAVRWDAHRSEDATWQVRAAWRAGHKSGTTRWSYDIPAKTVTPIDATTMDFAEGTRLVRVVPDVPVGLPAAPISRRSVSVVHGADDGTDAEQPD